MNGPRNSAQAPKRKQAEETSSDDSSDCTSADKRAFSPGSDAIKNPQQEIGSVKNQDKTPFNSKSQNLKPRQQPSARKRQKINLISPESEYTEIEYVKQVKQSYAPKNGLDGDLPPIYDLDEIFEQITLHTVHGHGHGLKGFIRSLKGRKLRVATICSGTESPILALEMIVSKLKKLGFVSFKFKHLFSAEIVEYKQAYIERNFRPPLLFRDAIELHRKTAHTAYGAEREVPSRPDLLVAGFPCVDYSNLNNWRKDFGESGKSDDTLRGLMGYCEAHRPKILILENITNAPWGPIGAAFEKIGYHFRSIKVDTKDYYLPQTRERVYAIGINKDLIQNGAKLLDEWSSTFLSFQRRASSPFTKFIELDDDIIEQRKQGLPNFPEPRSAPNWSLYKIRHADVRRTTTFGNGRPITHWEEGGRCSPAAWMDRPWFFSQVERVWDTIDVNHLRTLTLGYDNSFKVRCIDVSQGVDRDMDTKPFGVVGCITPCGTLYSTSRGSTIQGRELLALQGMPLSRLSLTRESQAQLQDLAGNAMSTTVIGPAIIAALMTAHKVLEMGPEEAKALDIEEQAEEHVPESSLAKNCVMGAARFMPPGQSCADWISKLKNLSLLTVSLCSCEGPYGVGKYGLYICTDCKTTACAACRENPIHNYRPIPTSQLKIRKDPKMFREMLLWTLPAMMKPPNLPKRIYEKMNVLYSSSDETRDVWKKYVDTVELVCGDVLFYKAIKRTHTWKVVYEGSHSMLQLTIRARGMQWDLFAKASPSEPARSYIREIIRHPIARMQVDESGTSLLQGEWQVCKPLAKKEKIVTLTGCGSLLPSYESLCGLPGSYQDQKVWSTIIVGGTEEAMEGLLLDIRGKYERIPNCGGAFQSLHRRIPQAGEPVIYFFLDPRRMGPSQLDSWIFSRDSRRRADDMPREIILQVDSKWSYQQLLSSETVSVLASYRQWISVGLMPLTNCDSRMGAITLMPNQDITLQLNSHGCYDCYIPILSVGTDLVPDTKVPWEQGAWKPVEISNFEEIGEFAWMWARFMTWSPCLNWKAVNAKFETCARCYPIKSRMAWKIIKGRERPIEDPVDAARCERDYKLRPSPFRVFTRKDRQLENRRKDTGHMCIALNVKTMFHRLCGKIAHRFNASTTPIKFYWRITSNDDSDIPQPLSYRLLNNNGEPQADQPPNFNMPLRSDQRRSLGWALIRESDETEAFREEEAQEAILEPLCWRAEAKVIVHRKIRGGILADHVGFGKTAVILGLIDRQHEKDVIEATKEPCKDFIPLKATCIIVPDILFDQWQGEISRFLGGKYIVLDIANISKLAAIPIKKFQEAEIVLVSWTVFTGGFYFKKMEEIAGGPSPPKTNSNVRMFEAWFNDVLGSIGNQVNVLQRDGPEAFLSAIHSKQSSVWGTDAYKRYLPSRNTNNGKGDFNDVSSSTSARKGTSNNSKALIQQAHFYRSYFGIPENEPTPLTNVKGTVLHMYRFQRLVIDEFTYLNQDRQIVLESLKARSRWIMSGTPPIKGFAATERMARLLNVYLGMPSDDDYEKSKYKRSESENFHFFRDVASRGWHFRRNGLAQYFNDVFMRQNTPEIPPIQWKVHYIPIVLSAVERTLYLELKLFFESYNPQTKGEKKEKYLYDQRGRVSEIIDTCNNPEESLIMRSSYYDALPRWSSATDKLDTMSKLISHRRWEKNEIIREIETQSKAVSWLFHQLDQSDPRFDALKASIEANDYGDTGASHLAQQIINSAIQSYQKDDWKIFWRLGDDHSADQPMSVSATVDQRETEVEEEHGVSDEEKNEQQELDNNEYALISRKRHPISQKKNASLKLLPESKPGQEKELREWINKIRVNILALVERTRALRLVESGHNFQRPDSMPHCQSCGRKDRGSQQKHSILGKCGHIICKPCLELVLTENNCRVQDCRAAINKEYIIPGRYFSMCQSADKRTGRGGTKMQSLIKLLKDTSAIPDKDQVILFLQFPGLEAQVAAALEAHNISYASMGMSGGRGRSKIKGFAESDRKVAILQLGTENAAGLNLQNANHVIFFGPFAAKSHYEYQSTITQSSGRVIRFGQEKEVHIWNLVTLNTLEVSILQEQDGRTLVRHADGVYDLVPDDEVKRDDVKGFEIPDFDWK